MARITKVQRRQNEQLERALKECNGDGDQEIDVLAQQFYGGDYTPWPRVVQDWGVFYTDLEAARELVKIANPSPMWKVLDLGAGLGVFSYALIEASVPAENILAIEALDIHCEIGTKLVPGVEWKWANAFEKPIWQPRMGQFDLVIGNPPWGRTIGRKSDYEIIGFITTGNPAEVMAMEAALRYLRPGGQAVLLMPMNLGNSTWSQYEREVAPLYEADREIYACDAQFAQTKVRGQIVRVERSDELFPG